jgi:hypothetical protein
MRIATFTVKKIKTHQLSSQAQPARLERPTISTTSTTAIAICAVAKRMFPLEAWNSVMRNAARTFNGISPNA